MLSPANFQLDFRLRNFDIKIWRIFYLQRVFAFYSRRTMSSWESRIENEGGIAVIEIDKDLRILFADIISRACFGSNYTQGEEIFLRLRTLEKIMSRRPLGIPGLRYNDMKLFT